MIDVLIDGIRALDHDREFRALTEHVAVTSPIAIELLAYEHLTSPGQQARRVAGVQLRVVHEFASKLRWLEGLSTDPSVDPGVRVGLAAVLRNLCADAELLPIIDSEAAALLEPASLFHALLSQLRPWIPPRVLPLEPDSVLELLALGIPDYLHPLVRQRFEGLWELFHRLRQLPAAKLSLTPGQAKLDDDRLVRLIESAQRSEAACPPAPRWSTPSWVTPWLGESPTDSGRYTRRRDLRG
ncbi:hypothetical protein [Enhygromyxa salina]|nr:hypothetical protein [Enhygromyxa salina]